MAQEADVNIVLKERGAKYGAFISHATIAQDLKELMRETEGWKKMDADQKECLEMIAHKIARALNGDPNYADNFVDIAGYATLVARRLSKKEGG